MNNKLVFSAGFHLGIILFLFRNKKLSGWPEISTSIKKELENSKFCTVDFIFPNEIRMPIGENLAFSFSDFNTEISLEESLKELTHHKVEQINNYILIFPTGVVQIVGEIYFDSVFDFNSHHEVIFSKIIEQQYCNLSIVFSHLTIPIYRLLNFSNIIRSNYSQLLHLNKIVHFQNNISLVREKQLDLIEDVYFFYVFETNPFECKIKYTHSTINAVGDSFLPYLIINYSTFLHYLWFNTYLHEKTSEFQEAMLKNTYPKNISEDIKLLLIFCSKLQNESKPISIRITEKFYLKMEEFWESEHIYKLENKVAEYFSVLEKIVDWFSEKNKAQWNYKIAMAATILSLVSISAVIASIISTLDFTNSKWNYSLRIWALILGSSFIVLFIILIIIFPYRKIFTSISTLFKK